MTVTLVLLCLYCVSLCLDELQGGMRIGASSGTNLRYADDVILLAISEAELHQQVDHLDEASRNYSLIISIDKTKVMANDGIPCHILIDNERLEQAITYPYCLSLVTEDRECTKEFCTRLSRASLQKVWKSHSIPVWAENCFLWPAAMCSCENWTLWKNEEEHLEPFEMKKIEKDPTW